MQALHSMLVGPSTQSKTVTAISVKVGSIGMSREPGTMFGISDRLDRPQVARPHNSGTDQTRTGTDRGFREAYSSLDAEAPTH
jgi:hypothetical protein